MTEQFARVSTQALKTFQRRRGIMATFSPSPAPRRSSRFQQRVVSPTQRAQRPNGSKLATPSHVPGRPPYPNAASPNVMDVDERSSMMTDATSFIPEVTTYAKTDELSVTFYANLPIEVKQVLRNAGMLYFSSPQSVKFSFFRFL